jgi:hypothetical protein
MAFETRSRHAFSAIEKHLFSGITYYREANSEPEISGKIRLQMKLKNLTGLKR